MDEQGNSVDLTNMIDAFEKFVDFEKAGVEGAEFFEFVLLILNYLLSLYLNRLLKDIFHPII